METSLVVVESFKPNITLLTLNRPEKRNALSMALMKELCETIKRIEKDSTQRVLIIRGAGGTFCAGLDLQEASIKKNANPSAAMVAKTLLTIHQTRLITFAAVEGIAVAGGAGIMSACDFVVAAANVKIGYPETLRGLVAGLVMTFLRRQLRERDINELLLIPDLIPAQRALGMGLIHRITLVDQVLPEIQKIADSILKGGPNAVVQTKRHIQELWPSPIKKDLQRALKHHLKARHSKEAQEGIKAFLEKRPPNWVQ
jgi:methylglutaconyl-CoA hydratase